MSPKLKEMFQQKIFSESSTGVALARVYLCDDVIYDDDDDEEDEAEDDGGGIYGVAGGAAA